MRTRTLTAHARYTCILVIVRVRGCGARLGSGNYPPGVSPGDLPS